MFDAVEMASTLEQDLDFEDSREMVELENVCETVESPFVSLVDEIEAWARHALASNGFGDY